MAATRIFRFAYTLDKENDGEQPFLHHLRDGDACIEILPDLLSSGAEFAGTVLNLPGESDQDASGAFLESLGPSDLIVINTRPPLNDQQNLVRRPVTSSDSQLESAIHDALRRCFAVCDRACTRLVEPLTAQLKPDHADRQEITYYVYGKERSRSRGWSGAYLHLKASHQSRHHPPPDGRTAVFLIRTALKMDGPRLLNAFGMSGNMSLIWAHLLRTRYPHHLTGKGPLFFMGELVLADPPTRPLNLDFTDSWEVIPLLETADFPQFDADDPPPRRPSRR